MHCNCSAIPILCFFIFVILHYISGKYCTFCSTTFIWHLTLVAFHITSLHFFSVHVSPSSGIWSLNDLINWRIMWGFFFGWGNCPDSIANLVCFFAGYSDRRSTHLSHSWSADCDQRCSAAGSKCSAPNPSPLPSCLREVLSWTMSETFPRQSAFYSSSCMPFTWIELGAEEGREVGVGR